MNTNSTQRFRRHRNRQLVMILVLIVAIATIFGCGNPDIDLSGYGAQTVKLIGLVHEDNMSKDIRISIQELKEMDCVTIKTSSTSDKIGEVSATGPLIDTIAKEYGTSVKAFKKIVITAKDGYKIVLNQPFINENKLILAFGINGKPLGGDEAPLRLIIPESDSAYWIRMIQSIEFIT
jgi:hypothetical protein